MSTSRKSLAALAGMLILVLAGFALLRHPRSGAPPAPTPAEKLAAALGGINQANAGLPDLQIQAKALIFAATIQRAIPAANQWGEAVNAGHKLWPVTPTNTVFALNAQVAGRTDLRQLPGDLVVFFETAQAGWSQSGGPELLANPAGGVAVALLDGRALVVSHDEALKLRWTP